MRENRPYGSEGGEGKLFPTPIDVDLQNGFSRSKATLVAEEKGKPPALTGGC
jgi:hypothetical protein